VCELFLFYLRGVSFARVISEIVDTFFSRKVLASKKPMFNVGSRYIVSLVDFSTVQIN
jgi:hypothetical protein